MGKRYKKGDLVAFTNKTSNYFDLLQNKIGIIVKVDGGVYQVTYRYPNLRSFSYPSFNYIYHDECILINSKLARIFYA